MRGDPIGHGWLPRFLVPLLLLGLNACAMVGVSRLKPGDVVSEQRTDVIGGKQFSDSTVQVLNVVALNPKQCTQSFGSCTGIVEHASGLDEERRLSALSELWLGRALRGDHAPAMDDGTLDGYLQGARYAHLLSVQLGAEDDDDTDYLAMVQTPEGAYELLNKHRTDVQR